MLLLNLCVVKCLEQICSGMHTNEQCVTLLCLSSIFRFFFLSLLSRDLQKKIENAIVKIDKACEDMKTSAEIKSVLSNARSTEDIEYVVSLRLRQLK